MIHIFSVVFVWFYYYYYYYYYLFTFLLSSVTNLNDSYLLSCFCLFLLLLLLFIHFPSLLFINYRYFNEKCPMIGRKISKGDMICHNKQHFCFVRVNIIKMVKQSGICPFEAKSNICSLTNFFFLQKIFYLETLILRYAFYRNYIYSRFYDMLTDILYGTGCAESMQNANDS